MQAAIDIPPWAVTSVLWIAGAGAICTALVKLLPQAREVWVRSVKLFRTVEHTVDAKLQLEESLRDMRRTRAVQHVMDCWVKQKGAQRCLLLVASNGGQAWRGSGPLKVSNTAQVVGPAEPNTIALWQDWPADAWYREFLGKLLETYKPLRGFPVIAARPGELADPDQPEGTLRMQYDEQGTVASLVLPFKWLSGAVMWYVSINFGRSVRKKGSDDLDPITDEERAEFVKAMRRIYDSPARCRQLILELRAAYDSVR